LGEEKPTLDQVARGEWPVLSSVERQRVASLMR
jgi:hypothetical protein